MPRLREKDGSDRDGDVSGQPEENRPLAADAACEDAEKDGAGNADELRQQQRADELPHRDSQLRAVDRRHVDDGPDAVIIEPEGEEKDEEIPVRAHPEEGLPQTAEAFGNRRSLSRAECRGHGLPNVAKERKGEEPPPDRDAHERETDAERSRNPRDHGGVDGEENAAAEIAERVPQGGDLVAQVGGDQRRQQRVVKNDRRGKTDGPEHIQRERGGPVSGADEPEPRRRQDAQEREQRQEAFFGRADIRDRAEYRGYRGADQERSGRGVTP